MKINYAMNLKIIKWYGNKFNSIFESSDIIMEVTNLLKAKNRDELREWLIKNYNTEKECWVEVKRGRPIENGTFWYIDVVEEAMCFGWIDSTTKKLDNGITVQKLAPRSKNSIWSELNKERCKRMEKLGRMTEEGRKLIPKEEFKIDDDILKELKKDSEVWENFQKFPELYQRVRIDTIQIKKKNKPELYKSRLQKLIENTKKGIMYGEWNDNGRLLDL